MTQEFMWGIPIFIFQLTAAAVQIDVEGNRSASGKEWLAVVAIVLIILLVAFFQGAYDSFDTKNLEAFFAALFMDLKTWILFLIFAIYRTAFLWHTEVVHGELSPNRRLRISFR